MIKFLSPLLFCVGKMVSAFCLHKKEMGKVWHNVNDFCITCFILINRVCLAWNLFYFPRCSGSVKLYLAYFCLREVFFSSEALADLEVGDEHKTGHMLLEYEFCVPFILAFWTERLNVFGLVWLIFHWSVSRLLLCLKTCEGSIIYMIPTKIYHLPLD